MSGYNNNPPSGSDTETTNVGALADGLLGSAINDPDTSNGSTAYVGGIANGDDRGNTTTNTDNSQDHSVDVNANLDLDLANGNDRNNTYDWDYDSKTTTDIKTTNITDTDVKSDYDWSYDSKSYSDNDIITKTDTDIKTITDTDIKTTTDTTTTTDSFNKADNDTTNTANSFNSSDDDFATLDHVKDFDNLGIASGDVNFNLGDNFSFTLDVDNILNSSLGSGGAGFSAVQANHLADQDSAWGIKMNNSGAENDLSADGGKAYGHEGIDVSGAGWAGGAGDDVNGASTADASAILANSGYHFEFVQGANMLSNSFDAVGHDSSSIGQDSSDAAAAG